MPVVRCLPRSYAALCFLVGTAAVASSLSDIPATRPSPCVVRHPSDSTIEWTCRRLRRNKSLEDSFGDRWVDIARFNRIDRRHAFPGVSIKVPTQLDEVRGFTPMPLEYPAAETEAKFIVIDQAEQFLGAYEYGALRLALPMTSGERGHETPTGEFRVTAAHRLHRSSLYTIEGTDTPYPMTYALRFHIDKDGVGFWIHGRDMPGSPVSHGCIGLYDEAMQKEFYGVPKVPVLEDAQKLYEWVLGDRPDDGRLLALHDGPRVLIVGSPAGEAPVP